MEENEKLKKSNNKMKVIIVILSFILVLAGLLIFLLFYDKKEDVPVVKPGHNNEPLEINGEELYNYNNSYKIIGSNNKVYLKNINTGETIDLNITYRESTDDETDQYIFTKDNNEYDYLEIHEDIKDNRIWLCNTYYMNNEYSITIYDYKNKKNINVIKHKYFGNATELSIIMTDTSYFYALQNNGVAENSYVGVFYNKNGDLIYEDSHKPDASGNYGILIIDENKNDILTFHFPNNPKVSINQNGVVE